MNVGINAANHRWYGALVKQSFLHPPDKQDKLAQPLLVVYQGVSLERARKTYYWSEHLHDHHEIIFIRKGIYVCKLNGHEMKLKSGDVLVIGPGDRHSDLCRPPLEYYALWFDLHQVADGRQIHVLRKNLAPASHAYSLEDNLLLKRLEVLFREEQRDSRFSMPLHQAMAEEILWRLLDRFPAESLNPLLVKRTREADLMIRLTSLFENNLRAAMTVRDIAKALNMSESSLAHICTELLGVSPAKALNRYRIEKAAQWLRSSDMTVKEIAIRLGFHDASHFIHAFRHQRGESPGAFRSEVLRHDGAGKASSQERTQVEIP